MRSRLLGPAIGGLLLLSACGESPSYDAAAVEDYLVESQSATFGGADITGATCPEDRTLEEGMRLTCTVTVDGAKVPLRVTLTDVHDERVTVAARPDGVLVSGAKLDAFVRSTLPESAVAADVDCGGAYVVAAVGSSLDCTLVLGSQEKAVTVKVLDESGRVTLGS